MKKVGISFKEKEKDLYDFLMDQISPSVYIKQLLKEKMKKEDKHKEKVENRSNNFNF